MPFSLGCLTMSEFPAGLPKLKLRTRILAPLRREHVPAPLPDVSALERPQRRLGWWFSAGVLYGSTWGWVFALSVLMMAATFCLMAAADPTWDAARRSGVVQAAWAMAIYALSSYAGLFAVRGSRTRVLRLFREGEVTVARRADVPGQSVYEFETDEGETARLEPSPKIPLPPADVVFYLSLSPGSGMLLSEERNRVVLAGGRLENRGVGAALLGPLLGPAAIVAGPLSVVPFLALVGKAMFS
jgi:hypothetical protein